MRQLKITGVDIFLEKRKTRTHVGTLTRESGQLVFAYSETYFKAKNVIPLGPELPLTQRRFASNRLFPSLDDRIPSRENPAFSEYCEMMGISADEQDPMVLLSTIGRKGPSSFIFYPKFDHEIGSRDLIAFREMLNLTTREFANVFEISQSSLNAVERNRTSGKDVLKRFEAILNFPTVAHYFIIINGGFLPDDKWHEAIKRLRERTKAEEMPSSSPNKNEPPFYPWFTRKSTL